MIPLPHDTVWPLPALAAQAAEQAEWAAWWAADTDSMLNPSQASDSRKGGKFWRRRGEDPQQKQRVRNPVHVPLAGDIAGTSADLLFADPAVLTATGINEAETAVLGQLTERHALAYHEAADLCAGVGGVWLRPEWNKALTDHTITTCVGQDQAIVEAPGGLIRAVTFVFDLPDPLQRTGTAERYRHLERWEPGKITHELRKGTVTQLGPPVPFAEHPDTAPLSEFVNEYGEVYTDEFGIDHGLLVSWVPNKPSRKQRTSIVGRADFAGNLGLLDSLDEVFSSWMRDIRLGQARLLVADGLLEGPGRKFETDDEIFSTLPGLDAGLVNNGANAITPVEFKLRVEEHSGTAQDFIEKIVSMSGYAPQTFGLHTEGAISGKAHQLRELRTHRTIGRKERVWAPQLVRHSRVLAAIDAKVYGTTPLTAEQISVEWAETDADEPNERATTIETLRRAEAISDLTAVKMAQPSLTDEQAQAEVDLITGQRGTDAPAGLPF